MEDFRRCAGLPDPPFPLREPIHHKLPVSHVIDNSTKEQKNLISNIPAVRCQHIRTSGIQCGSPAMRNRNHCYYHQHWRPAVVNLCQPGKKAHFTLPILEDAHSIQFAITQIMHLLMEKTIDTKSAGLMLYALQIASSNLKQLNAETPRPSQVVTDLDEVIDAPLEAEPSAEQYPKASTQTSRKKKDEPSEAEIQRQLDYLLCLGRNLDEPAETFNPELKKLEILADTKDEDMQALSEKIDHATQELEAKKKQEPDGNLPPGTIQACISTPKIERNSRHVN